MATTTTYNKKNWDTLHKNGPFPLKKLLITELEGSTTLPDPRDRYNDATVEIQRLLQESLNTGEGFRAYGSRWSLSNIAHHPDRLHYNSYMNLHLPITKVDVHADSEYDPNNLFFFECGNTIKEISQILGSHGKSLKTTGASNGQTIAGCISTGVHGSALDVGAVQDYVVGIHLLTGPDPSDSVYLERESKPALNDAFAKGIKTRIIRKDDLYNAALVSLGSFGFIHGVVLEAEDRFLLKRYVKKIDKNLALNLAETMDFENSNFKIEGETNTAGKPTRPYHYKVFMNPYADEAKYVVELMYKKKYETPYPDPFTTIQKSIYRDLIYLLIKLSESFPKSIPWFIKKLEKQILPEVDEETIGTLYETFWDAPYQGPAFACSIGVEYRNSARALDALVQMTKKEGPIPGIFAMRFVKQSQATLAFTQFPITCMIEIDGVLWDKSNRLISLEEYSRLIIDVLRKNSIAFTMHWGKNSDWSTPGLVSHMYGEKAEKWIEQRGTLLSKEMASLFSNPFLEKIGLAH